MGQLSWEKERALNIAVFSVMNDAKSRVKSEGWTSWLPEAPSKPGILLSLLSRAFRSWSQPVTAASCPFRSSSSAEEAARAAAVPAGDRPEGVRSARPFLRLPGSGGSGGPAAVGRTPQPPTRPLTGAGGMAGGLALVEGLAPGALGWHHPTGSP